MKLPSRLFFTGVPGSRWSGISQILESLEGVNTSDHNPAREYCHAGFTGHRGAYFGPGMEFSHEIEFCNVDEPWTTLEGMKIVKSHEWAYSLDYIKREFVDEKSDWIMLVYRPDMASYTWWIQAGGFDIKYPSYHAYKNFERIHAEIVAQNKAMLEFAYDQEACWSPFTSQWVRETFGQEIKVDFPHKDILVTVIK